ncbi:MAG: dephospho-CoA kinase, partial [Firmicutes bacterium]|nr:dephospho-CoA kinase [Bacillota bacterium]
MKVIGLTGSIGSGKSTVSNYLIRKGFIVIDSDAIAHDVVKKGKPALNEISEAFGKSVIGLDGELNRKKLADIVFKHPKKKARLEEIVTARVISEIKKEIRNLKKAEFDGIVFVDAPILFESGANINMDEVWVVVADDSLRAKRVMERDGCT